MSSSFKSNTLFFVAMFSRKENKFNLMLRCYALDHKTLICTSTYRQLAFTYCQSSVFHCREVSGTDDRQMGTGGSRVDESYRVNTTESFFKAIHVNLTIYYWIILITSIVALVGNLGVIATVYTRNYKYLQKTCMISLALSDILTVVSFCINYLDLLGKPRSMVWSTGEFLCWYNPVFLVLGNLASSLALLIIAFDRYHNVIYALNRKWDPKLWKCIVGAVLLWSICFGAAFPMSTFYYHLPLRIEETGENVYICTGSDRTKGLITYYYVSVALLYFFPLITMFFWFYYSIANLIWRHRKPVSSKATTRIEEPENTSSSKSSSHSSNGSHCIKPVPDKKKNTQMQRKIRTFKIVIILILAFVLFRMPYWLYRVIKLVYATKTTNAVWRTTFIFTALNIGNCAMNPFLYTYLNQTIYVSLKVYEFVYTNCCCCFSNDEFQEYESGNHTIYEGVLGRQNQNSEEVEVVEHANAINPNHERFPQVPYFPKYTAIERF